MSLIRVVHNKNYTIINNTIATDARLSWKAKGLFFYAFSRPEDWSFYISEIIKKSTDGKDSVYAGLKELEKYGYLVRNHKKNESGQFDGISWTFYEVPQTKNQESPQRDNPLMDNPPLLNTYLYLEEEESKKSKALEKKEESKALERKLKLIKSKTNGRINLLDAIAIAKKYPYCVIAQAFEKYSATKKKIKNPLAYLYKIINELNVHLSADEKEAFEKVFTHNELASILEALEKFGGKDD